MTRSKTKKYYEQEKKLKLDKNNGKLRQQVKKKLQAGEFVDLPDDVDEACRKRKGP